MAETATVETEAVKDPIRVMLVEDHPGYREVIELGLAREADIELISQFGTSEGALRALEESQGLKSPDVILLDLNLPGIGGLESIASFRTLLPDVRIIILTQSDREANVLSAISQGAAGYLLKSQSLKQITESIRTVAAGGASLDASVAAFILTTLKEKLPSEEIPNVLTAREMDVLKLLADGFAKKEIADQLGIGVTTVVTHVANIYDKLDAQNAPAAISRAFRMGILPTG